MATASGQVTNAVYGFTSMLLNLVRDHQPDGIGVAFDRPEPTFRHEAVVDYKAGRNAAPDILRQQMGLVRQVVEALRIPIIEAPGFEADDIIATLATEARDQGDVRDVHDRGPGSARLAGRDRDGARRTGAARLRTSRHCLDWPLDVR